MIQEKEVVDTWVKIPGKQPLAVFLNGDSYINPEFIDTIINIIESWKLNKGMKK